MPDITLTTASPTAACPSAVPPPQRSLGHPSQCCFPSPMVSALGWPYHLGVYSLSLHQCVLHHCPPVMLVTLTLNLGIHHDADWPSNRASSPPLTTSLPAKEEMAFLFFWSTLAEGSCRNVVSTPSVYTSFCPPFPEMDGRSQALGM